MLGLKDKRYHYTDAVKQSAIESVLSGAMSYEYARQHYGIVSHNTLRRWVKGHELLSKGRLAQRGKIKLVSIEKKELTLPYMTPKELKELQLLKQELEALRQSEKLWRIKAIAYQTLVEVTEEVLEVPAGSLRKKYGARLSKDLEDNCQK